MKFEDSKRKHVSCIYCLTFPNGKKYIGKTIDLGERMDLYESISNGLLRKRSNGKVGEAVIEFGISNVDVSILSLVTCANKVDLELCLSIMEIRYIRELNTIYPNGYNVSFGGEVLGIPIEHITTDKDAIANYTIGNRVILEYDFQGNFVREYVSLARFCYESGFDEDMVKRYLNKRKAIGGKCFIRDKRYNFIPKKIDVGEYEVKDRVKYKNVIETRTIVREREYLESKIPVIAYDYNGDFIGVYESKSEACRKLFNGKSSFPLGVYYKGFILFKKTNDDYPKKIESKDLLDKKQLCEYYKPVCELEDKPKLDDEVIMTVNRHSKLNLDFPINQFNLNGEFVAQYKSIRDASADTGIQYSLIYNCVVGATKKSKGYIWQKAKQKEG